MSNPKADPDAKVMPCLLCGDYREAATPIESNHEIEHVGYDRAIACHTRGNWGSRVHDDCGVLSFIICDECAIKHAEKMLFRSYYDENGKLIQLPHERDKKFQKNASEEFRRFSQ